MSPPNGLLQDPSTYEDPAELLEFLQRVASVVPSSTVSLNKRIGSGEFGDVYLAALGTVGDTQSVRRVGHE